MSNWIHGDLWTKLLLKVDKFPRIFPDILNFFQVTILVELQVTLIFFLDGIFWMKYFMTDKHFPDEVGQLD